MKWTDARVKAYLMLLAIGSLVAAALADIKWIYIIWK